MGKQDFINGNTKSKVSVICHMKPLGVPAALRPRSGFWSAGGGLPIPNAFELCGILDVELNYERTLGNAEL